MLKVIYLNAGHSVRDIGTQSQYGNETDINRAIRDKLVPELKSQGFKVEIVPDDLNLKDSIKWVNKKVDNIESGLALSIHQNCCDRSGPETYYYAHFESSKRIAQKLLGEYCLEMGIEVKDKMVRSDNTTRFGELGWLRRTDCWAALLEIEFIDNPAIKYIIDNPEKVAKAICMGVLGIYGLTYKSSPAETPEKSRERIIQQIKDLLEKLK